MYVLNYFYVSKGGKGAMNLKVGGHCIEPNLQNTKNTQI